MTTLGSIYRRNARLFPDHPALVWESGRLTHRELLARIDAMAAGLARLGVGHGDRVAVLSKNSPLQVIAFGACELAGFVAVAVNFRLSPEETAYILADSGARTLVFEEEFAATVAQVRSTLADERTYLCDGSAPVWARSVDEIAQPGESLAGAGPAPDDLAYLIYTSGTTGRPKGVMLDHRSQLWLGQEVITAGAIRQDDRALVVMPLYHIGAKSKQLGYAMAGATVHLRRGFDAAEALDLIEAERITGIHLAPVMVQMMLDANEKACRDTASLRVLHYASAPMPVAVLRRAIAAFGPIFVQYYGMTETGVSTVLLPHQHVLDGAPEVVARLASAGQPTFWSAARVVDEAGRDVAPGAPGEVLLAGPTVMRGYWNKPEATAEAMQDGWMRTGDIGRLDAEGFLFIVDRKKDVIISGGENIFPREVEEALHGHPAVDQVAVIGVPDERWGESVKACVVLKPGATASADDLIAYSRTRIASYKKPRFVEFLPGLPRLANGKVDKKVLRAAAAAHRETA